MTQNGGQEVNLPFVSRLVAAVRTSTDALTQLSNRHEFDHEMARLAAEIKRHGRSVVVALIDIDRFKTFNDTFGHCAGDEVLRGVAQALKNASRESDLAARYGGEEFALILPGTSLADAEIVVERSRAAIEQAVFHFEGNDLRVTVSAGLAELLPGESTARVIQRAGYALYASKDAGRNCVRVHEGQLSYVGL
jgi:diguanylate cyclase